MNPYNLIGYRENIYSQYGDDGIIAKIIEVLEIGQGWFVEFGAWDGAHLSNTGRGATSHHIIMAFGIGFTRHSWLGI